MKTGLGRTLDRVTQWVYSRRWLLGAFLLVLAAALLWVTVARLAAVPSHWVGELRTLEAMGRPGVSLRIVYPTRLAPAQRGEEASAITLYARSLQAEDQTPLTVWFSLSDESLAFVDTQGRHVPGVVQITPGYPEPMPQDLLIVHRDTQLRGPWLRAHRVTVSPSVMVDGRRVALEEMAFQIRVLGRAEEALRRSAQALSLVAFPLLLVGGLSLLAVCTWRQLRRQRNVAIERRLSSLYASLQGHVKLESWADARSAIEQIQALTPDYRDVGRLDGLVSAAETAAWRRERLYEAGVRAYKSRDWPSAVQSFGAIEEETPYYRDVRFLRRTAALYADLASRDRSLRVSAARQLGEVADLVDMAPLLHALGDRASEVADAAEASFRRIGLPALDTLLGGLAHETATLRERSFRLIEGMGQASRSRLSGALRSSEPRVSAAAARLLIMLGARQELADSLAWAATEHQEGIVAALLGDGAAACEALLRTLLRVTASRQQIVIRALGALKAQRDDVDRQIDDLLRRTKDPLRRELLQRALKTPAEPFHAESASPDHTLPQAVEPESVSMNEEPSVQRLRLIDPNTRTS